MRLGKLIFYDTDGNHLFHHRNNSASKATRDPELQVSIVIMEYLQNPRPIYLWGFSPSINYNGIEIVYVSLKKNKSFVITRATLTKMILSMAEFYFLS